MTTNQIAGSFLALRGENCNLTNVNGVKSLVTDENIDLVTIGKQLSETLETIESRLSDITERLNKLETQGSMVRTGPPGPRGPPGEKGTRGEAGLCDVTCRNNICYTKILENVTEYLNELNGKLDPPIVIKNSYIKEKMKQMLQTLGQIINHHISIIDCPYRYIFEVLFQ